ncbi:MAG: hypothetical protein IJE78_11710 [Bacteroidaceae bacterium]|nr:hypothetical protein [Bacteroidaceae bacterium]
MKTNIKTYLSACLVMAAMGSCSHEAVVEGTPEKELRTVSLQARIGQDSRIAFEEDESSLHLLWEENDAFSVMVGTAVQTPATFTLTDGAGTADGQFSGEVYCSDGDTLYSVWPTMVGGMTGVHQCYWSLEGQQGVLDDQYTYMVGAGLVQEGQPTVMTFRPMTAAVRMHLVLPEEVKELVQVDVRVDGVEEGAWVNYDSGGLLMDSKTGGGVTINNKFTVVDGAVDVVAYFFAWQYSALKNGKVVVTDAEGRTYAGALVDGDIRPGVLYDTQVELSFVETENITIVNEQFSTILQEILGSDKVAINARGYAVIPKSVVEETKVLNLGIMVGNNKQLESLAGIEHFVNLEEFYFRNEGSSLVDIDFSKNLKLKNLQLVFPHPETFDLSKNVELETLLLVGMTTIEHLDLSHNTKLTSLNVEGCCMETLDITPLPLLQDLYCVQRAGAIDTIDVYMTEEQMVLWNEKWQANNKSGVNALLKQEAKVVIENAELSLALKARVSGYDIWINEQGFAEMKLTDVLSITSLNFDNYYDEVTQTKLTSLAGIEHFVNLTSLRCCNAGLQEADLSKNTLLWRLFCYGNPNLTKLDISGCNELRTIDVSSTGLTSLNISHPEKIGFLDYGYTSLSLDLSKFTGLDLLACQGHNLSSLNLPESSKNMITQLMIGSNNFTSFDVSEYPNLWSFHCEYNQLTSLDLSKAKNLGYFSCEGNYIDTLDISNTIICNDTELPPICGPQKNNITLILKATPEQKAIWKANNWSQRNERVYFEGEEPAKIEGGTSSGEDFESGGNF